MTLQSLCLGGGEKPLLLPMKVHWREIVTFLSGMVVVERFPTGSADENEGRRMQVVAHLETLFVRVQEEADNLQVKHSFS